MSQQFVISTLLSVLSFAGLTTACLSSGNLSTGAALPQTNAEFDDGELKATVKHHCSGGRCKSFSVEFENLSAAPVQILPTSSKITRAGESFAIAFEDKQENAVVVEPKSSKSVEFVAVGKDNVPHSYVKATEVWCTLKVDSQCKDSSRGEALCAGFARYYHQSYVNAGGWLSLEIAYKNSQNRVSKISTTPPQFFGDSPSFQLSVNDKAPGLFTSGDVVVHRVTCDADCKCSEPEKRRNFFTDDKFAPIQ